MKRIHRLSEERQALWRKVGLGGLNASELSRVQQITDELYALWDTYRRELAGDVRVENSRYGSNKAA